MPEGSAPSTGRTLGDSGEVHKHCDELESSIAELKASYEQYFLGVERKPPTMKHDAVKKKMNLLRNTFVRQTAAKFRVQNMAQKLATYERLWARTLKEMEEGTYKRDIFKARLHREKVALEKKRAKNGESSLESEDVDMSDDDDAPPSTPPDADATRGVQPGAKLVTPAPAAAAKGPAVPTPGAKPSAVGSGKGPAVPAPGANSSGPGVRVNVTGPMAAAAAVRTPAPAKAPVAAQGDLSDQKVKAIFDAYLTAKKRCNEDVSKLSLDSLASTLRKQVPELIKQHKAKSVEFKVVIKDGKAILRALPK